jgi:hypothetical protein
MSAHAAMACAKKVGVDAVLQARDASFWGEQSPCLGGKSCSSRPTSSARLPLHDKEAGGVSEPRRAIRGQTRHWICAAVKVPV